MPKLKIAPFKWVPFSKKQLQILTWWLPNSPVSDRDAIICDGSVRAGKTVVMIFSYVLWAMTTFDGENFGIAGKTIGVLKRNVLNPLKQILKGRGISYHENRSENYITITFRGKTNTFYLFGGKDERSQDFIQGITLAGVFFDEVALMPRSFVDQATARCSVDGSKLWFNCNPGAPRHWFKSEWIDKRKAKRAIHLHFTMDDNPSLSERVKERYRRMYSGVFYKRYVLGLWVMAEGLIYDMFDEDIHVVQEIPKLRKFWVSIDYGTTNPTVFLLHGQSSDNKFFTVREYRWDSVANGRQKTDLEYSTDFRKWILGCCKQFPGFTTQNLQVFIDPSAASFALQLTQDSREHILGLRIVKANNDVLDGIRALSSLFAAQRLNIHESCEHLIQELSSYTWDPKKQLLGQDEPLKQNDHGPDALRYFVLSTRGIWLSWMSERETA